jgi:hypothetical protein
MLMTTIVGPVIDNHEGMETGEFTPFIFVQSRAGSIVGVRLSGD